MPCSWLMASSEDGGAARISDAGYLMDEPTGGPEYTVEGIGNATRRLVQRVSRHSFAAVKLKTQGNEVELHVGDAVMLTCNERGDPVEIGRVEDLYQVQHKKNNPDNEFTVDVKWWFRTEHLEDADVDGLASPPHERELFESEERDSNPLAGTFEG